MNILKRTLVLFAVIIIGTNLIACGGSSQNTGVKVYTMNGTFNSEENNIWRNLYLVDDDTYILEIEVLNSQDFTKHTVEFVMRGEYTLDGTTIALEPGYGSGYVMNGETKIPCTTNTEEWTTIFEAMFGVNGATKFTLNDDGTYKPAE